MAERDQVIAELTIANRIQKNAGRLALTVPQRDEIKTMFAESDKSRMTRVPDHRSIAVKESRPFKRRPAASHSAVMRSY